MLPGSTHCQAVPWRLIRCTAATTEEFDPHVDKLFGRAARISQGAPLTDEENTHLLARITVQPMYQELLHAASGHNASVKGERKRPCSGLLKKMAKQRQAKTRAPVVNTACV